MWAANLSRGKETGWVKISFCANVVFFLLIFVERCDCNKSTPLFIPQVSICPLSFSSTAEKIDQSFPFSVYIICRVLSRWRWCVRASHPRTYTLDGFFLSLSPSFPHGGRKSVMFWRRGWKERERLSMSYRLFRAWLGREEEKEQKSWSKYAAAGEICLLGFSQTCK